MISFLVIYILCSILLFALLRFVFKVKWAKYVFISLMVLCFVIELEYGVVSYRVINIDNKNLYTSNVSVSTLVNMALSDKVTFVEEDEKTEYTYSDLGIEIDCKKSNLDNIITEPFIDFNSIDFVYNTDKLDDFIAELNTGRTPNKYSELLKKEEGFVVTSDFYGNFLDKDKLKEDVISNLGKKDVSYTLEDYYIKFNDKKSKYMSNVKELDKFETFNISYSNGTSIKYTDFLDYFSIESDKIVFNEPDNFSDIILEWLKDNLDSYNTVDVEKEFTTTMGYEVRLNKGTYGDIVDFDKELEFVLDSFRNHKSSKNRLPEYELDLPDVFNTTYIEVSLSNQHLWYYVDGKLDSETDIVTGHKGKHDTPTGVYYISECIDGKYLTGDTYKTWVDKWMRLTNNGIGLHDASWRGSFGGKIYTYNGSHGCINLPKKFAYELFDKVERKTAVIIY